MVTRNDRAILRSGSPKVNVCLCLLAVAIGVIVVNAQDGGQPAARDDQNSRLAHAQLVEKARRGGIDVYFEGDSITRRWGTSDLQYRALLENWTHNFFGWNAANFGWGGDTVQNILWRLENGELDDVNPKVIVVLAGTNNVGAQPRDDQTIAEIARGIKAIIAICQQKAPSATVLRSASSSAAERPSPMPTPSE